MRTLPNAARQTDRGVAPLALPVIPLPVPEETSELEGRWSVANLFAAFAIGGVLARAAYQARFRWWFLNLGVALVVGAAGSIGGGAVTYGARRAGPMVLGREPSREQRFCARFMGSFISAGLTFDVLMSRLEGRAVWRGTYGWWWAIAWPLAALMLFVNATEVQADVGSPPSAARSPAIARRYAITTRLMPTWRRSPSCVPHSPSCTSTSMVSSR